MNLKPMNAKRGLSESNVVACKARPLDRQHTSASKNWLTSPRLLLSQTQPAKRTTSFIGRPPYYRRKPANVTNLLGKWQIFAGHCQPKRTISAQQVCQLDAQNLTRFASFENISGFFPLALRCRQRPDYSRPQSQEFSCDWQLGARLT